MKKKMKIDQPTNEKTLEDIQEEQRKKRMEEFPPVSYISLFRYATVTDHILQFIGFLGLCATAAVAPLNMLFFGTMTASFVDYAVIIAVAAENNDTQMLAEANDQLEDDVHTFAVKNTLLGTMMFIGSYVTTLCFQNAGINMGYKIRSLYLEKVFNQDISWYDMHQSGDFASRMGDDLTKLEDGIGEKVGMFLHSMLSFVACILMSMIKGWELALVCLVSLPITAFAMGIIAVITSKFAASESDAYGAAGTIAEETFSSIRTVLAFAGEKKEIDNYSKELTYARDNNIIRSMFGAIGFGILWFCIYSSYALSFWYGINLVVDQVHDEDPTYDAENMIQVFFSIMTGSFNFGLGAPFIETFGMARGAAAKIFGVIDHEPTINLSKNNGKRPDTIKGNIEFKNIEFHYPSRPDVEILRGLDLKINSGETVALVGSSGCGKSTTIQLIQRFYDPIAGDVLLDGNNVKDLDLTWLRQNIGVVGQEPVLFGTTIGENIRYGNPTATQEMIEKACKKANAHRFISSLPDGYNTTVGERGAQLSGGQKQRIAIARALVREPAILLLDEATSALDTNSEAKVQAALDNASKECTTIIIAHRLSTIRGANRIMVVNKGRASEEGTHEELMKKKGEYYDLVMTQVSMVDEEDMKGKRVSLVNDEDDMPDKDKEKTVKALDDEEAEPTDVPFIKVLAMNKPEWKEIIVGVIGAIVMGAAMPVFSVLFGNITSVLQYAGIDNDYVDDETRKYCLYFLGFGITIGLATFLSMYAFGIAAEKMLMRIRCQMFSTMLRQEIGWYDRKENGVGALCAKLSTDAALIQGATGQRIGTIFQSISTIVIAMALAMYYQWKLGLVSAAFTPIILGAMYIQLSSMRNQNQEFAAAIEKSTKLAVEAVGNIRTVASLVCEDHFKAFYAEQLQVFIKKSKLQTHFRALVLGLARSIMLFAFACSMYYGGVLVREEGVYFEDVLKVSQSLILGTASIANALSFAPNFQRGIQSAGKVFNLYSRVPRIQNAHDSKDTKWEVGNIEYKNIEFAYPTRPNTTILQGLNLTILRGKTVALVGPSGCGKSTLIQLLERYYDPMAGEVMVDDDNLKNITMSSLRSHLGIVSQEPNLFARSIGLNIAYGDNSRDVTQEEIIAAARKANIHNFVSNLPLGYETPLGDKGAQLSGGQKQRVAIARALVRNPKVLLLDEATSALDTESEKVVQAALDEAKVGRTCITIAHRLTTIQDADVICVVNEGVVHEMGTHHELIELRGIYHKLYTLQMGSK